jgi:hypothetical protein
MSFRDYTFPDVTTQLQLTLEDGKLFEDVQPRVLEHNFTETVRYGLELATANRTEKAKSEFVIAPILLELKRTTKHAFKLFSGSEWSVDPSRGLNGYCDFILTRGASQFVLDAPFVAIAEAKNDLLVNGYGQCISAMYAGQLANERAGKPLPALYGIVSTAVEWQFLRLAGTVVTIDPTILLINALPRLMGVLHRIVEGGVNFQKGVEWACT